MLGTSDVPDRRREPRWPGIRITRVPPARAGVEPPLDGSLAAAAADTGRRGVAKAFSSCPALRHGAPIGREKLDIPGALADFGREARTAHRVPASDVLRRVGYRRAQPATYAAPLVRAHNIWPRARKH